MDLPYFSDDDYDDSTGEYQSTQNFEPTFSNTFWLDAAQTIQVTIQSFTPDAVGPAFDALETIVDLASSGVFEPDYNPDNPHHYEPLPDDFDIGDKNVRGPFLNDEALQRFLSQSGLRGIAIPYYDDGNDEFWIDIDTI